MGIQSGPTTDTPSKQKNFYLDIIRSKVASYKHVTLVSCSQVWAMVMIKIFGPFYKDHMHSY